MSTSTNPDNDPDQYDITLEDHNGRIYRRRISRNPSDAADATFAYESLSFDVNDIKEDFVQLTDEQRNFVMHIYYQYIRIIKQGDIEAPKIILQGAAGTGKSTIIHFIDKLITWEENTPASNQTKKVMKCAYTGKAASNIEGATLNYTLSIPIKQRIPTLNTNSKIFKSKKKLLRDCLVFICDEISMVGEQLMDSVNKRLKQIFENEQLYGGRLVLLVGDLFQLNPVYQTPVYPNSELWTCCKFYELTKIMRQTDEEFVKALNNFRDYQMTNYDIDLLKSRETEPSLVPNSVIHLFYQGKHVDEYNTQKLDQSSEKEEKVNSIVEDTYAPSSLRVKIGMRYMIVCNIDVSDGLANGTTGVVKEFDYDKDHLVSIIWMEFYSNAIGKKARSEYFKKHSKPGFENWVPIQKSRMILKSISDPKYTRSFKNMFPLKVAEAITVHKSQGQTYREGVCLNITNDKKDLLRSDKTLQYVALTRVTRLDDLYIIGSLNCLIPEKKKFINTQNELKRLRSDQKLQLAYETFEDNTDDVIIFLNTGSTFYEHYEFITADKWYGNGSLLIFSETNTVGVDEIVIPNFEIAYRSDEQITSRSNRGLICYEKKSKTVEVISLMPDDENESYLTLLWYGKYLYIVTGEIGHFNNDYFMNAIDTFIEVIGDGKCIFFIGSIKTNEIHLLSNYFTRMNFEEKIRYNFFRESHDMVFTRNFNIDERQFGFYEYIPSHHKPIYVKIPPMASSVDHEQLGNVQQSVVSELMEVE